MHNIEATIQGGKLIIEIDISPAALKAAVPSKTGKTLVVASTHGNKAVSLPSGQQLMLGINAYMGK